MATFLYTGTPIEISYSAILRVIAVDGAGIISELVEASYEINPLIDFVQPPYATISANRDLTIYYETLAYGVWEEQRPQTQSATGTLLFTGAIAESQAATLQFANAQTRYTASISAVQQASTQSIPAKSRYTGSIAEIQAKQTAAVSASETYRASCLAIQQAQSEHLEAYKTTSLPVIRFTEQDPINHIQILVDSNGTIRYSTAEIINAFYGAITQTSPANTVTMNGAYSVTGDIATTQAEQLEALNSYSIPQGIYQTQTAQLEAIAGSLIFSGGITTTQSIQRELASGRFTTGEEVDHTDFETISVSYRNPLAISVTPRNPIELNISAHNPLAIRVESI